MVPVLVTVNVTGPAVILLDDSSTFHSDNLTLTAARSPGMRRAGVPASASAVNRSPATFRDGTASMEFIRDLPPEKVRRQCGHCRRLRARGRYSTGHKVVDARVFS